MLLLVNLANEVPFAIPHFFDCALFILNVPLSFLATFYPGLEFKIFLLKASQLHHQLVLLLHEFFEAVTELGSLRFSYCQLCLQLPHSLLQLVSLEIGLSCVFYDLLLGFTKAFKFRLKRPQFKQLTLL